MVPVYAAKVEIVTKETTRENGRQTLKLHHHTKTIECAGVATLAWDGDELVDGMNCRVFQLDGVIRDPQMFLGYPFDRALCRRSGDVLWILVYENRGTKALLLKNGKVHRELNRSYYFAKSFDYPIALATIHSNRVVVVHAPDSYDSISIEDVETGEVLGTKKSGEMEFHSRLSVSGNGEFVVSAGWFWHPLGGAWLCSIDEVCGRNRQIAEVGFSFGAEIDSVGFLGDDRLVLSSTKDVINEQIPSPGLGPRRLAVWSIRDGNWLSNVPLKAPTGMIMPWKEWGISFYDYPKAIELATGKVVHRWKHLRTGRQIGSIELGTPPPPTIALDPQNGRFAIADEKAITVVTLESV